MGSRKQQMSCSKLFLSLAIVMMTIRTSLCVAQRQIALIELPDAPSVVLAANNTSSSNISLLDGAMTGKLFIRPLTIAPITKKKDRWDKVETWTYRSSQVLVLEGLYADAKSTDIFMEHSQHASYRETCFTTNNGIVTSGDCGWVVYRYFPDEFIEKGWAVKILRLQNRNTVGVIIANSGFDGSLLLCTRWAYSRNNKKMKTLAIGINLIRAGSRYYAAYANEKYFKWAEGNLIPGNATDVTW